MAKDWEPVERMYMEVKIYWIVPHWKRMIRMRQSPWDLVYQGEILLTNLRKVLSPILRLSILNFHHLHMTNKSNNEIFIKFC